MVKYIGLGGCRLEFLRHCLDDPAASQCGRCDNCAGPFLDAGVSSEMVDAVAAHLDRVGVEIPARRMWPPASQQSECPYQGGFLPVKPRLPGEPSRVL